MNERLKQLSGQYLLRTGEELVLLKQELPAARGGQQQAVLSIQHIAHRICGSGAMLGFKAISDAAGQIERTLRRAELQPSEAEWIDILSLVNRIEAELQHSANTTDGKTE